MNQPHPDNSLSDVHRSVDPARARTPWRRIVAFFGPAYLVSVGYMDPGNWATDLAGGAQFGYRLIWVLLMSNIMALLLQSLSARLGVVQGRDLAQCNRETYPRGVNFALYILAEIAIAACDLAEVLGVAIGLNLLLGIPLIWGVLLTLLDTFLLLYLQRLGMRKLEAFIVTLILIIGACFAIEIFIARPDVTDIAAGFVPYLPNHAALYIAIGIIGATVMPHNLYLHSALVQTRKIGTDDAAIKKALRFNNIDSAIALNMAFFVNAAILILAGAVFYTSGRHNVASLQDAYKLLTPLLGNKWASHLFAIALIAAGQSSTITGTLAGQIVMEGYLKLRINPILRRLITRLLAIVPAVIILAIAGDSMVDEMLIFSQVLLSMQLAFAVIPLILFVSDKHKMGKFAIGTITKIASWLIAGIIVVLNLQLVMQTVEEWMASSNSIVIKTLIILGVLGLIALLLITFFFPLIRRHRQADSNIHRNIKTVTLAGDVKPFNCIALALDYSDKDSKVIQYALQIANPGACFVLIHIVESASASISGSEVHDQETIRDREQLDTYVSFFTQSGHEATGILGFKKRSSEIARIIKETHCDLLIIGSHGHKTLGDFLFGQTINSVRHMIEIPVFIAK